MDRREDRRRKRRCARPEYTGAAASDPHRSRLRDAVGQAAGHTVDRGLHGHERHAQAERRLNQGLDAGLTISGAKEILVQLYAYAGFPRSLNALGELMKVVDARKQRGVQDAPGRAPGPVPTGRELLARSEERRVGKEGRSGWAPDR